MKALLTLALLCLSLTVATDPARAGLTDWWLPSSSTKSSTKSKSSKSKAPTKKPFPGSKSAKNSSSLKMPDVVGTVSNKTKKAYSTTKAMLTPSSNKKKHHEPRKITGSQTKSAAEKKDSPESTSAFGSLFASKKEPEPPRSIKEWMSLPRLDP
jgi:hypothetical protein